MLIRNSDRSGNKCAEYTICGIMTAVAVKNSVVHCDLWSGRYLCFKGTFCLQHQGSRISHTGKERVCGSEARTKTG